MAIESINSSSDINAKVALDIIQFAELVQSKPLTSSGVVSSKPSSFTYDDFKKKVKDMLKSSGLDATTQYIKDHTAFYEKLPLAQRVEIQKLIEAYVDEHIRRPMVRAVMLGVVQSAQTEQQKYTKFLEEKVKESRDS